MPCPRGALVVNRAAIYLEVAALVHKQGAKRRSSTSKATHPIASRLVRMRGIGPTLAGVLATELFYRRFENRKQVACYTGLTPTPYSSGSTSREQGISKTGNNRVRHNAIELAWLWLRHQPESRLATWYRERVTNTQGPLSPDCDRSGRAQADCGVVAVRCETGLIPEGALLRSRPPLERGQSPSQAGLGGTSILA